MSRNGLRRYALSIEARMDRRAFEALVSRLERQAQRSIQIKRRRRTRTGMPLFELRRKVRALARWQKAVDCMSIGARGACCPSCVFGEQYVNCIEMADRIRAELGLDPGGW